MDLLGKETQKKEKTNAQKIVLMLLITSVVLFILILMVLFSLKDEKSETLKLFVDGKDTEISQNMFIKDENGVDYISLYQISKVIGYDYLKGEYKKYEEDDNKCYLENETGIIGFETNSKKIYKTLADSVLDYAYYDLKNKIIKANGVLYVALEDLSVSCNVAYSFSNEKCIININTPKYLLGAYKDAFSQQGFVINEDSLNQRAIIYNMVVAENETGKLGVLDTTLDIIIGHKYNTIQFEEFSQTFIVSSENKYGIISKDGKIISNLKYDSIRVINHSPLLYEVKLNNKFGVLNEQGKLIINTQYDKLGFLEDNSVLEPTIIVKNASNNQDAIIVYNELQYGLVNITTGEILLKCSVEKIYSKSSSSGEKKYYVQFQNQEIELNRYLEYANQVVVVTN